jgi:DNA-binding response OmpR family regulator
MADTILVVDDDQHIIDLAKMYIELEGYNVESALDGLAALKMIQDKPPALIVLDLMLPNMDGWEVCKRVRATSDLPIIMLTARSEDIDKIVGLELGADDYLTKPFNPRELVARIRAILRRLERRNLPDSDQQPLVFNNLVINPVSRVVKLNNKTVDLRMKEFDLLMTLAENQSMVFSRERLLDVVWGYNFAGETRTVDVHVAHLRHKLEGMQANIETVWGVGYKFVME